MQDELRVTVVATGLNRNAPRAAAPAPVIQRGESAGMRIVPRNQHTSNAAPDYSKFNAPPSKRKTAVGDGLRPDLEGDDMLDIPAFLRRQAD